MNIKFSIITCTFNAENYLQNCINSVKMQGYTNFEYILIDGGSKDRTLSIIEHNLDVINKYVSEPDNGIYNAWNKGLKLARGEWIMFLGADDELLPNTLSKYHNFLIHKDESILDYVSGKVIFESVLGKKRRTIGKLWRWDIFRKYMNVAHVASLHSSKFFEKYGYFNESFKIVGDYELLLRAGGNLQAAFVDSELALMRDGGVSNNPKKVFIETFKAKRLQKSRSYILCVYDLIIAWVKFSLKFLK
ncbi:glycosyltransferase family 2 protein [Pedobacter sp. KACC 23697]|uniref:Glycosyltransferase family 2 protein n=1 Tax=Pedobacter sp. KACC 23697 TaxID=3149230 RepID=A0AAU7K2L6_9SPHI